jgi:hypothetical protein
MSLFGSGAPASPDPSARYDTVSFPGPTGEQRTLPRAEFEKLPLVERVRLLAGGQMRFFRGGEEVSPGVALGR